jgi:signal transduction histidine kinase
LAYIRHINSSGQAWIWVDGLPGAAVVIDIIAQKIVAANASAAQMDGIDRNVLVGAQSNQLLSDYLLPTTDLLANWAQMASAGQNTGAPVDLLVEIEGAAPARLTGHMAPADSHGQFVLLTLAKATGPVPSSERTDAVVRSLMSDIGRIAAVSLDLTAVCQQFATSIMQAVPVEHVAILLTSADTESLDVVFSTGRDAIGVPIHPTASGIVHRAMEIESAVLLDEAEIQQLSGHDDGARSLLGRGVVSAACVPFVISGSCIGVVLLGSSLVDAISFDDLQLLEHAASQVAGTISHVMLHETLTDSALEREVLADIGRIASAASDFANSMPGIAEQIQRFMPVSELYVHEPSPGLSSPERPYSWSERGARSEFGAATMTALEDFRQSAATNDQVVVGQIHAIGKSEPIAVVTAPLRLGGNTIGTLTALAASVSSFSTRELFFAELVAGQIAGAVQAARAYQYQQREANLRRTLARISLASRRDLAPDRVFERVANEVAEVIQHDIIAIAVNSADRDGLVIRFHIGPDAVLSVYENEQPAGADETYEWRERIVRSVSTNDSFTALADHDINSLLEVSLGVRETGATGYILVGSSNELAFTRHELRTLAEVAAQVTPAIQNAVAHEQTVALAESRMAEARAEARNRELERINDAKSRFLSIVSHELRTPLTSIIAYAELLQRNATGTMSDKQVKQAAVINNSATHLKFLISDLLDVSRIESGNLSLELSTFQLGETILQVIDQFEPVLEEKQQEFDVHIADEQLMIRGDRSRIMQIVSNLVENSSKYSANGTTITVNVHRRGREALIRVSDEGAGISVEDQAQLFRPFFRGNSELTRTEPGTGLGLALVKSIAELHGGSVSVISEPGKVSVFTVSLLAASAEEAS